jgi:hypothetical protein
MHNIIKFSLIIFLSGQLQIKNNNQIEEVEMNNEIITVTVTCIENDKCLYEGEDLFIKISIKNNLDKKIGFPLKYIQKKGPYIKLINTYTSVETNLKSSLANWSLKRKFKTIRPGGSVTVDWVIFSNEIKSISGNNVDLTGEISIVAEIKLDRKIFETEGICTLHIVGKNQ